MEVLRFQRLASNQTYGVIKVFLLILGTLGLYAALASGDTTSEIMKPPGDIVSAHESAASLTTFVFSLLSLVYLSKLLETYKGWKVEVISRYRDIIFLPTTILVLAVAGFFFLLSTGALGGFMVYGTNADSVTKFLANFWIKKPI